MSLCSSSSAAPSIRPENTKSANIQQLLEMPACNRPEGGEITTGEDSPSTKLATSLADLANGSENRNLNLMG